MTGSGTRNGKVASIASRYLSASGNALRKIGERRCETRQGSMIVLASITIFRLWSGSEMNSRTFMVTSFFLEYFETAMPRPGVMAGRWMTLPSISAPGTRPNPALPTITDSAGVAPPLPGGGPQGGHGGPPLMGGGFRSFHFES